MSVTRGWAGGGSVGYKGWAGGGVDGLQLPVNTAAEQHVQ